MCHENKFETKQGQEIDANGTGTDFFPNITSIKK